MLNNYVYDRAIFLTDETSHFSRTSAYANGRDRFPALSSYYLLTEFVNIFTGEILLVEKV